MEARAVRMGFRLLEEKLHVFVHIKDYGHASMAVRNDFPLFNGQYTRDSQAGCRGSNKPRVDLPSYILQQPATGGGHNIYRLKPRGRGKVKIQFSMMPWGSPQCFILL